MKRQARLSPIKNKEAFVGWKGNLDLSDLESHHDLHLSLFLGGRTVELDRPDHQNVLPGHYMVVLVLVPIAFEAETESSKH